MLKTSMMETYIPGFTSRAPYTSALAGTARCSIGEDFEGIKLVALLDGWD